MVFRTEARIGAILMLAAALSAAQTSTVTHRYVRHEGPGTLSVTGEGIAFVETGKHTEHSRGWKYEHIQQLVLAQDSLTVLTYEDSTWQLGRDRTYVFTRLQAGFSKSVYALWRDKLDQRFVAALADDAVATLVEFPAKLTGLVKGVEGTLLFGDDRILFRAAKPQESRTWRFSDIENIASAGPYDLSIVTLEHHGAWNAAGREFRFQLQRPMEESRFNELWRKVTQHTLSGLLR